jgi:hypothetical protein
VLPARLSYGSNVRRMRRQDPARRWACHRGARARVLCRLLGQMGRR